MGILSGGISVKLEFYNLEIFGRNSWEIHPEFCQGYKFA